MTPFRWLGFYLAANLYFIVFQNLSIWLFVEAFSTKINSYLPEVTTFFDIVFFNKIYYFEVVKIHTNYFKLKVTTTGT